MSENQVQANQFLPYFMFNLALLFILLLSLPLHHLQYEKLPIESYFPLFILLLIIWLIFILEFVFKVLRSNNYGDFLEKNVHMLLPLFFPPARLAVSSWDDKDSLWIPFLGWKKKDRKLGNRLEKAFSMPMFVIAMMILAIIAVEQFAPSLLIQYFWFGVTLFILKGFIWAAFVAEFIMSLTVARKKLHYCVRHWLEMIIILLPFLAFFRSLRILQVLRISNVAQSMRVRSVVIKVVPVLLLFETNYRKLYQPEKHLARIEKAIEEKELELAKLKEERDELKEFQDNEFEDPRPTDGK